MRPTSVSSGTVCILALTYWSLSSINHLLIKLSTFVSLSNHSSVGVTVIKLFIIVSSSSWYATLSSLDQGLQSMLTPSLLNKICLSSISVSYVFQTFFTQSLFLLRYHHFHSSILHKEHFSNPIHWSYVYLKNSIYFLHNPRSSYIASKWFL